MQDNSITIYIISLGKYQDMYRIGGDYHYSPRVILFFKFCICRGKHKHVVGDSISQKYISACFFYFPGFKTA